MKTVTFEEKLQAQYENQTLLAAEIALLLGKIEAYNIACRASIAALSQNKVHDADIKAAKSFLQGAIDITEG